MDPLVLAEVRRRIADEDEPLQLARARAPSSAPSPEIGALLAWAAAATSARAAVEIGACGGVSGLWLARGLAPRGVLTSVEADPYAHGLASDAFEGADTTGRVRCIQGDPATVLPRLSDGGYDLVLLQDGAGEYPDQLTHARRLLRPGGLLIARRVLRRGEDADALARFVDVLAEDHEGFRTTVLDVDEGLVLATRLGDDATAGDPTA